MRPQSLSARASTNFHNWVAAENLHLKLWEGALSWQVARSCKELQGVAAPSFCRTWSNIFPHLANLQTIRFIVIYKQRITRSSPSQSFSVLLGEIPVELIKADESHALPAQGLHQLGADLSSATNADGTTERKEESWQRASPIQRDVRFLTMFSN